MSSWWWVNYHPKHVEQLIDLNKLYSVASCWVIIAILYDARSIEHKTRELVSFRLLTNAPRLKTNVIFFEFSCSLIPFTVSIPVPNISIYITACNPEDAPFNYMMFLYSAVTLLN